MSLNRFLVGLTAFSVSTLSFAQEVGTLTYGPALAGPIVPGGAPIPVPIPSLLLFPLAIAMAFFGYRALRKQGGKQLLGVLLVASGIGMSAVSSLHIRDAVAALIVELNQPEGGSVDIPLSDAIYTNTSGVTLEIGAVTPPPSCTTSAPADECLTDLELVDGASCSTAYDCTQTISFTSVAPPDAVVGGSYAVAATATSGLPVTFSTASMTCSVSGSTVTFTAAGDCVIDANQAGDADYEPAPLVQQIVGVGKQAQTISFTSVAPPDAVVGGSYAVAATATSGLPVTFSTAGMTCSVSGSTVTFTATGDCVIDANQAGSVTFAAAPQVQQTVAVELPVVTGVLLFNYSGPEFGSLNLYTGIRVAPNSPAAQLRDLGIDLSQPIATNWSQKIAPVNGAILKTSGNGQPAGFSFESVTTRDVLIAAFEAGTLVAQSDTVQVGDIFLVRKDDDYFILEATRVEIITTNNNDNYEFSIKKSEM